MNKVEKFATEIGYIKNPKYRENIKILIDLLPDYFFEVAASSTGKYHPSFSLGEGGLLRHTKTAVRIAYEMFQDESISGAFNESEKDMMIMALILHDGLKHGDPKEEYVKFDHPILICDRIRENKEKTTLTDNEILALTNMIESHMGPWNTNKYSDVVLPVPKNKYQKFVHMCDFLSSRKFLDVKFENDEIVI